MIHRDINSLLFATGLSLNQISNLLTSKGDLEKNIGKISSKYLQRYKIIKEYFSLVLNGQQKLPLIFIITGIPGVGKTSLAKELSLGFNIGIAIGGDALRSSIRALIKQESFPAFFTSVYNSWQIFGDYSKENLLSGYKKQAEIMNTAIQHMIVDRALRDGESMIVEYLHFLPRQFSREVISHPSIIPLTLKISDKEIYLQLLKERHFYSHLRSPGDRLISHAEKYLILQEYQCQEIKQNNLPIFNIDNFETEFDKILTYIFSRIKEINELKDYKMNISLIEEIERERTLSNHYR